MPEPGPDALADRRQLVVIVRLVTAATGRLLYGEVIDVDSGSAGRFADWRGMTAAVRHWLADELSDVGGLDPEPAVLQSEKPIKH